MGLAGLALALLGCDVVLTDVVSVLPLLRRNADANLGKGARAGAVQVSVKHLFADLLHDNYSQCTQALLLSVSEVPQVVLLCCLAAAVTRLEGTGLQ